MKNEEVKKPTPKAPAPKTAPKTTGKAPGKGSSAVAPPTNDDDLGVGMSKEEADAMVQQVFATETLEKCEESKW